jgi:hypothetical protein
VARGAWADLTLFVDPGADVPADAAAESTADAAESADAAAGPAAAETPAAPAPDAAAAPDTPPTEPDPALSGTFRSAVEAADESAFRTVVPVAESDDEQVDPEQAYRERAASAPERYLRIAPLTGDDEELPPEVIERIASVLRLRTPVPASVGQFRPRGHVNPDPAGQVDPDPAAAVAPETGRQDTGQRADPDAAGERPTARTGRA